jgi:hypothetical protein
VWCETLTFDEVVAPRVVALLRRYRLDLLLAVRPWQLADVGEVVERLRGAGVFVALWPMVADEHGRWASVQSSARFVAFGDAVVARAPGADELILDLEPPLDRMAGWKAGRPTFRNTPSPRAYAAARAALIAAVERWRAERRVTTAIVPLLVAERGQWLQRVLGTPTTDLPVARHSVMAYTTLLEGWSRGLIDRRRAEAALGACARLARRRFGAQAALSLGTIGPGAVGDEPCYRDPGELARDVALAAAAGIDELSLFDLGGILRRGPAEAWLEAFG